MDGILSLIDDYKKHSQIEELENIKETLKRECVYLDFCYTIDRIVNERISELKGDSK